MASSYEEVDLDDLQDCSHYLRKCCLVCIEKISRSDCPVCLEDMHTSRTPLLVPSCGHMIHEAITCPICCKSYDDAAMVWKRLDEIVGATPLDDKYKDIKMKILCRDCHKVCRVRVFLDSFILHSVKSRSFCIQSRVVRFASSPEDRLLPVYLILSPHRAVGENFLDLLHSGVAHSQGLILKNVRSWQCSQSSVTWLCK
eukprot:gene4610-20883_t